MNANTGGGEVSYAVKELLEKMDIKLERIDSKLDGKAEKHDMDRLFERMRSLETRAVMRDGPLAQEMRESIERVSHVEAKMLTRDEVEKSMSIKTEQVFTRSEKLFVIISGALLILLNFYQALYEHTP